MNNPLNIEYSAKNSWVGAVRPHDGTRFEKFKSILYCIRAGRILLRNYGKLGKMTVRMIISTYALSSEYDTERYIRFVCQKTFFGVNEPLDMKLDTVIFPLLKAMCKFESDYNLSKNVYYESILI